MSLCGGWHQNVSGPERVHISTYITGQKISLQKCDHGVLQWKTATVLRDRCVGSQLLIDSVCCLFDVLKYMKFNSSASDKILKG